MKIGVHILFFNQDKWIIKTIENCGPFVDKIYIAWSSVPWNYNPGAKKFVNKSSLEILKQSKYYDKIVVIEGEWKLDEDERNACLDKAKQDGMDYLITQDADEFYTNEGYKNIIEGIKKNPNYDYYTTPWIVFWKNFNYVVVGENSSRGLICGDVEIALNLRKNVKFVRCRRPNSKHNINLGVICYHMCFVLTDEECWEKINTWGHSHQFNIQKWYNEIWLNWKSTLLNIHPISPKSWHKTIEFKGKLPEVLISIEF